MHAQNHACKTMRIFLFFVGCAVNVPTKKRLGYISFKRTCT